MVRLSVLLLAQLLALAASAAEVPTLAGYFDHANRTDVLAGGIRMIPVTTPKGTFNVWTKRIGNNPRIKVLLLHGGPGATHEYLEAFDSYFPGAGIEYYYYDQLGSAYSDQPEEPSLWEIDRFVDEVEQVRSALGLGPQNFYLYGQSWGGLLAIEYALAHQDRLKGLIVSNMVSSIPGYNDYAKKVLMPMMDQQALAEIQRLEAAKDFSNPRYEELLMAHYYVDHILRMPLGAWPDPLLRAFAHLNHEIYVPLQGPSELGASGKIEQWDRTADLAKITVPTLMIGARYDTMDPKQMRRMAGLVKQGRYLYCPQGSHMALYDDQQVYFDGLVKFLRDVDAGRF
jgi:proline iminopeptidase